MDVSGYYSSQLNRSSITPYSNDLMGGIKLIEDSGFSSYKKKNPLNATLNQIFEEFKKKTGFDGDTRDLNEEFLGKNPKIRNAMNLFNSLESTFSSDFNKQSAIENFLNEKIDDFISANDENNDNALNINESEIDQSLLDKIDENSDEKIDKNEMKSSFFDRFNSLKKILNHFKSNPGTLLDTYA